MPALVPNRHDIPSLEDVKNQSPQADCQVTSANVSRNLILNRGKPPFDNADLRRAVALSLDPKPLSIFSNGYRMEDVWLDLCISKMMPPTGAGCHGPDGGG